MSADSCWLTSEVDAGLAVVRFLADFTGPDRAQAVHLVLKQLRQRTEPDRVLEPLTEELRPIGLGSSLFISPSVFDKARVVEPGAHQRPPH